MAHIIICGKRIFYDKQQAYRSIGVVGHRHMDCYGEKIINPPDIVRLYAGSSRDWDILRIELEGQTSLIEQLLQKGKSEIDETILLNNETKPEFEATINLYRMILKVIEQEKQRKNS